MGIDTKIQIELTRVQAFEIVCLLSSLTFREDHAGRFKRMEKEIQKQLIEQSTIEEIIETTEISGEYLDGNFYPEIIGEK